MNLREEWLKRCLQKREGLKNLRALVLNLFNRDLKKNQLRLLQSILDPSHRRVLGMFARQAGKSETIAIALALFPMFFDNIKILVFAPKLEQAMISFERASGFIHTNRYNIYAGNIVIDKANRIKFRNGTEIRAISASLNSEIEGLTAHIIILDESQLISSYKVKEAVYPMGGQTGARIIQVGVPRIKGTHFYDAFRSKRYVKHIYPWDKCPLLNKQYVLEMKETLDPEIFDTQYNLKWATSSGLCFTEDQLRACENDYDFFGEQGNFLGIDFAKSRDSTVITELRYDEEIGESYVVNWWELQGTAYNEQIGFIKEICHSGIEHICADRSSVGEPIIDLLNEALLPIEGINMDMYKKDALYKHLRSQIQHKKVHWKRMPNNRSYKRFFQQMSDLEIEFKSTGLIHCHHPNMSDAKDDFPDSLALAVWASSSHIPPKVYLG